MPFRALKLGYPSVVELEMASRIYPETFPLSSRIRFEFPERDGLPPCKFWWYDGNPRQGAGAFNNPCRPPTDLVKEIVSQRGELPTSGRLASLMGSIKIASRGGQNHRPTREEIGARYREAFGAALW